MRVPRGNSGTDKLAAAGGGMQVLRGNSGTDRPDDADGFNAWDVSGDTPLRYWPLKGGGPSGS